MSCIASHDITSPRPAKGFTLVELLVSITILVILATVTLYGMASVQKMAQIQKAKSQIARIHELIMEKWESYETRSVSTQDALGYSPVSKVPESRDMRLLGIRELMRFELPDRITDIYPASANSPFEERAVLAQLPPLARYYLRRTRTPGDNPAMHWTHLNESAECLYLIVSAMNVGDASALEFFSEEEIGDTDGDSAPEIVDPWGRPITFIRWPAGYSASAIVTLNEVPNPGKPELSADAFDLANREFRNIYSDNNGRIPHSVFPLIISAGPDGQRSYWREYPDLPASASLNQRLRYSQTTVQRRRLSVNDPPDEVYWPNDPFAFFPLGNPTFQVGQENDASLNLDNITNHFISTGIK